MKTKHTFILLAAAVVLFAFTFLYVRLQPTTDDRKWDNEHLLDFDAAGVDSISITNSEDKIELRLRNNEWRLVSPVDDRANLDLVQGILAEIHDMPIQASLEADGKTPNAPSLRDMGLETPTVRIKISGKDVSPPEVIFGKDTAVEGQTYTRRVDGTNTVRIVKSDLKTKLQQKADDFRDHRLMDFSPSRVVRFDVKSPAGEIETLVDHSMWIVNKPLKARADGQHISDLIARTVNTMVDSFIPEKAADLAAFGLAEPRGSISLTVAGSDTPAVLEIGQPVDKDKKMVYAKLSTRESILVLPERIDDILFIKPNDVRDKFLLELNPDVVDRVHIEATGKPKLTLARKGEDWTLKTFNDLPANTKLVNAFIQFLRAQKVDGFVSDVASDLPKYGLDKPALRITFSSYASENTAETSAGEDTILSVAFGKAEGNVVYARLESEPYVVALPRMLPDGQTIFDAISSDPVYWEDLSIYKFKPDDIVTLDITREGQTISLERPAGGGPWKLKQGLGAFNQTTLQSLVNTLATLNAFRSLGSSTSGLGFDKPALMIAFTTASGQTGKLTIGARDAEEGAWTAEAEGRAGAFLVSGPDYEGLSTVLTAPAEPETTPGVSPSAPPTGAP